MTDPRTRTQHSVHDSRVGCYHRGDTWWVEIQMSKTEAFRVFFKDIAEVEDLRDRLTEMIQEIDNTTWHYKVDDDAQDALHGRTL